jgi:hypothetical protein
VDPSSQAGGWRSVTLIRSRKNSPASTSPLSILCNLQMGYAQKCEVRTSGALCMNLLVLLKTKSVLSPKAKYLDNNNRQMMFKKN